MVWVGGVVHRRGTSEHVCPSPPPLRSPPLHCYTMFTIGRGGRRERGARKCTTRGDRGGARVEGTQEHTDRRNVSYGRIMSGKGFLLRKPISALNRVVRPTTFGYVSPMDGTRIDGDFDHTIRKPLPDCLIQVPINTRSIRGRYVPKPCIAL